MKKKIDKKCLAVAGIFIVLVVVIVIATLIYQKDHDKDKEQNEVAIVEFPLCIENGNLEIGSLFQFSGINPDCDNQEGEDIAAITLTNLSDSYLTEAKIAMELNDGTELYFDVIDLPAGTTATAFSTENQSITTETICNSVECNAVFETEAVMNTNEISVQVDGTQISLTNVSGRDISQVVVYCRTPLDDEYFGGITYQYTVSDLVMGETVVVHAEDCFLGMTEVIRLVVE